MKTHTFFKKYSHGFTLIEILITITIIGILASVVVASLNTARDKATDASVKSNLHNMKGESGIYYDDNRSYTNICSNDQKFLEAMAGAQTAVSGVVAFGGLGDGECVDISSEWAAWVNLQFATTTAWCVDSTGISQSIPAQDSTAVDLTACP